MYCKSYEFFELFELDCLILTVIRVLYVGTVKFLMSCSRNVVLEEDGKDQVD